MNLTLQRVLCILIISLGLLTNLGYAVAVLLADDRHMAAEQWGALAGFGLFSAVVCGFWLLAMYRSQDRENPSTWVPPLWLSFLVFVGLVATGFGLQVADRGIYFAPVLAILAFVAVGAFFLRFAARWMPDRRLPIRNMTLPGAWGVFVSPVILMIVQGSALVLILLAMFTGIIAENPDFEIDPDLGDRISSYIEESGTDATSTALPEIVESPTVALSLFSMVAIIAPISEELIKAVGPILVLSRRSNVTRSDAFFAAVAAGLGFALFEGVGYTLASTSSWQQLILFRAPVVVMHIAATTIVVVGWFRARETGRGFIPYFLAGTALHAGWNALYVGFIYSLTGIEAGTDPSGAEALGVGAMALLLGALFIAGVGWFASAARKTGHSDHRESLHEAAPNQVQSPLTAILRTDSP